MSGHWDAGGLWRVVFVDPLGKQHVWCETSNEAQARASMPSCPGGEPVLQQLWESHQQEWRPEPVAEPAAPSGPDWSDLLPLSETQTYVLEDLRAGIAWAHRTGVLSRLRGLGLIERDPQDSERHQLTEAGSALATALTEHRLTTSRRALGYGALAGSRMRYGVNAECSCGGWKGYSNESASGGGESSVRYQHALHLATILTDGSPPRAVSG